MQQEIKVLDKGFVKLIGNLGDDQLIVDSARVSYDGKGKSTTEQLIDYLMRHNHMSPFEMPTFILHIKMPIVVARQWFRYRTASINEQSGRYVEFEDEYYLPEEGRLKKQSIDNKQGSSEELIEYPDIIRDNINSKISGDFEFYKGLLHTEKLAKEVSRMVLPLSLYTEFYWKNDLRNIFHLLEQRLEKHAQWEIREYAKAIYEIVKPITPIACKAFEEHILYSTKLSKSEMQLIKDEVFTRLALDDEWFSDITKEAKKILGKSKSIEFIDKLGI